MTYILAMLLYSLKSKKSDFKKNYSNKSLYEDIENSIWKEIEQFEDSIYRKTDIITIPSGAYNLDRFYTFLLNVEHGIKDYVRIILHDVEGNPIINNAYYDGNIITLIIDDKEIGRPITYTGDNIQEVKSKSGLSLQYYLSNNGQINRNAKIFSYPIPKRV